MAGFFDAPGCEAAVTDVNGQRAGVTTVNADGTYSEDSVVTITMQVGLTQACVSAIEGQQIDDAQMPAYCDALGSTLASSPDTVFDSASCTFVSGTCHCGMSVSETQSNSGTYTVNGSMLETVNSDGESRTSSFCVQGNQLLTQSTDDAGLTVVTTYARS